MIHRLSASKYIRRYICIQLFVLTLLALAFAGCDTQSGNDQPKHDTYIYTFTNMSAQTVHAGDPIPVRWEARPAPNSTSSDKATHIVLKATLAGPFSSPEQLKNSVGKDSTVKNLDNLNVEVQTDNWTNKTYDKKLQLPTNMVPGYYNLTESVTALDDQGKMSSRSTSSHVIQITNK